MSNSPLICHTHLSPNCSRRTHAIDTITIHCMAGNASIEACGNLFADPARRASSNYGNDQCCVSGCSNRQGPIRRNGRR